jgi:hypothetical protein
LSARTLVVSIGMFEQQTELAGSIVLITHEAQTEDETLNRAGCV